MIHYMVRALHPVSDLTLPRLTGSNEPKPFVIPIMTVSRFRAILYTAVAIVAVAGLADATYLTVQALTGGPLAAEVRRIVFGYGAIRTPS